MSRRYYLLSNLIVFGSGWVLVGQFDLFVVYWMIGVALVLQFLVIPFRFMNTGIPAWICWAYAFIGLLIPVPGTRLVPWAIGFFMPKGSLADLDLF